MFAVAESVDINRTNEMGHTPLMIASGIDGNAVLKLLQRKAEIEAMDMNNFTAMHHASYFGNNSSCKILLEYEADVNACEHISSPLKEANRSGFAKANVLLTLLRHGANFREPNSFGQTPLEFAERYLDEDDERIQILRKAEQNLIEAKHKKKCCLQSFYTRMRSRVVVMLKKLKDRQRKNKESPEKSLLR